MLRDVIRVYICGVVLARKLALRDGRTDAPAKHSANMTMKNDGHRFYEYGAPRTVLRPARAPLQLEKRFSSSFLVSENGST